MHRPSVIRLAPVLALAALVLAPPRPGVAGTKIKIAGLGDPAPGGGQFLGPGLTSSPSASGNGWVVFRSLVNDDATSEQIVAANLVPGAVVGTSSTYVVASIGGSAGKDLGLDVGSFKQFLGRPTINADGDVAFVATLTNSERLKADPLAPIPAGVFLYKRRVPQGEDNLSVVALSRVDYGIGPLDFGTTIDPLAASLTATDVPERTPGLNDGDDVAFAAATAPGGTSGGAIFVAPKGKDPAPVVKLGDAVADDTFGVLGAPALTNGGRLVYRGVLDRSFDDGIFATSDGTTTVLVRAGQNVVTLQPLPLAQTLFDFGDTVSANDAGDVLFTAGPLFDGNLESNDVEGQPGVFVVHEGALTLLGYPGDPVPSHPRITGITLGPEGGNKIAPPALGSDGTVVFFAELGGGKQQAIFRLAPPYQTDVLFPYVLFGGADADASPIGGTYQAASSAPAIDDKGNVVLYARLAGTTTSEALVFLPTTGLAQSIVVGKATQTKALLGGPPFSGVVATDGGDVVFKSFIAVGPSALGLFRWRDDPKQPLSALVHTGDAMPLDGAPRLTDIAGDPSANASGAVAFTGVVEGNGRVVLAVDDNGLRRIAANGDDLPAPPTPAGSQIRSVAAGPLMLADGSVVFRATYDYPDPLLPFSFIVEEGVFVADPAGGLRMLARSGTPSPAGTLYFRFRELSAANGPAVAFRSVLGDGSELSPPFGLFLVAPSTIVTSVAVENEPMQNGVVVRELVGRAGIDATGNVAFLGKLTSADSDAPTSLVRRAVDGTISVLATTGGNGPMGGTLKSLSRPTVSSSGHLAYRASFISGTGGIGGFYLVGDGGTVPVVLGGESDDDGQGGRLASINPIGSLNAKDHLAFVSGVSGGKSRNGVFLASPASLTAQAVGVRLRDPALDGSVRDSVRGRFVLRAGDLSDGFRLVRDAVTISFADASTTYFTATVRGLVKRGGTWVSRARAKPLRSVHVRTIRDGARVSFSAGRLDLFGLTPPLTFRIDVGNDSGIVTVPCDITPDGRVTCK